MNQSFAADDFDAIRRRLEELRTERAGSPIVVPADDRRLRGPRPYHVSTGFQGHLQRQAITHGTERKFTNLSGPTTLRDACRLTGCDRAGRRCESCRLAVRCHNESHWLVRTRRQAL